MTDRVEVGYSLDFRWARDGFEARGVAQPRCDVGMAVDPRVELQVTLPEKLGAPRVKRHRYEDSNTSAFTDELVKRRQCWVAIAAGHERIEE